MSTAEQAPEPTRRLLVESDRHQTRVAVLEDGRLTEIHLERNKNRSVVGSVFKGRVSRILPGMQAAFVDIGLARDAFLYAGDVREALSAIDELSDADPQTKEFPTVSAPPIEKVLTAGEELIVQVVKAPLPNKGARITTEITLPGRYLVLVPTVASNGISRRVQDADERDRLRAVLAELDFADGGLIVRTAGAGRERDDFEQDLAILRAKWQQIQERGQARSAPSLLHGEEGLALRFVRDRFTAEIEEVLVDGTEVYDAILSFTREMAPQLADRVRLWKEEGTLFEELGIEREIDAALRSKVWLRSGGYIVINPTEALVAIDVNTGRFVGRKDLESTVLQTNLEAVEEIVRQIRLRDLSGIIVVDLIDMTEVDNRENVFAALQRELKKDRAKHQVLSLSEFGLVEITRKRSRDNLSRLLTRPCPTCEGSGRIRSLSTICLRLRREILARANRLGDRRLIVFVHAEVLRSLESDQGDILEELRAALGDQLAFEADAALHHEEYHISEV
ncbi:MAG: Rne/Rng family ribonuclease [Acidobacteriota bacterium]|nr:Rne/Rng family ribonuclease [Acidobacteriota bacterium]